MRVCVCETVRESMSVCLRERLTKLKTPWENRTGGVCSERGKERERETNSEERES